MQLPPVKSEGHYMLRTGAERNIPRKMGKSGLEGYIQLHIKIKNRFGFLEVRLHEVSKNKKRTRIM